MSGALLAIDPGNIESGYTLVERQTYKPMQFGKVPNDGLLSTIRTLEAQYDLRVVIEMIGHYGTGMAAGKSVFDTCIWIGRFIQLLDLLDVSEPGLVKRATVKTHITGQAKAKDGNVTQALIDRFAPDTPNRGKGTKAEPGFFYGFKADIWQAYALAVYALDKEKEAWQS